MYPRPSAPPLSPPPMADVFHDDEYDDSMPMATLVPMAMPVPVAPAAPPAAYYEYNCDINIDVPTSDRHLRDHRHKISSKCSMLRRLAVLLLYSMLNYVLALAGFIVVSVGMLFSVVTLPLCGFGVVVLQALMRVVSYGCRADVLLHNFAVDENSAIRFGDASPYSGETQSLLPIRMPRPAWNDQRPRYESTLDSFSPRTILAMLYFGSVKILAGLLNAIPFIMLAAAVSVLFGDEDAIRIDGLGIDHDDAELYVYLIAIGVLPLSLLLLYVGSKISLALTRFFCCVSEV